MYIITFWIIFHILGLTLNEVLVGSLLLFLAGLFDVAEELVEVAGGGVHLFLLGVSEDLGDVLVGGLEAQATDKVTNLNCEFKKIFVFYLK